MKYFRYAHLAYAGFFTLCALTVLRLGSGPGFGIALKVVLAAWLISAIGSVFKTRWGWFGSAGCAFLIWLLLLTNLQALIGTEPHSDRVQEIVLLTGFLLLPMTLILYGLWKTRREHEARTTDAAA